MRPRLHAILCNEIAYLSLKELESSPPIGNSPWDDVANLIKGLPQSLSAQPDKMAYDVVFRSLRNASCSHNSELALSRVIVAACRTAHSLMAVVANGIKDLEKVTSIALPSLIGVLVALSESNVAIPTNNFQEIWNLVLEISNESIMNQVGDTLDQLEKEIELTRYRQRFQGYWHRGPVSSDHLHALCMIFIRNSLLSYLRKEHVEEAPPPSPGFKGVLDVSFEEKSHKMRHDDLAPWKRIANTSYTFSRLSDSKMPKMTLEQISNFCYQHFKRLDFSLETKAVYLQLYTLSHMLCSGSFDEMVSLFCDVFLSTNCPISVLQAASDSLFLLSRIDSCPEDIRNRIQSFFIETLTNCNSNFTLASSHTIKDMHVTPQEVSSLRESLARGLASNAPQSTGDFVASIVYRLVRHTSADTPYPRRANALCGLRTIACCVHRNDIFETVIPVFMRVLGTAKETPGDDSTREMEQCLSDLAQIALNSPLENFSEIIKFISQFSRKHMRDEAVSRGVVRAIGQMAEGANCDQMSIILHTLLTYFVDKAALFLTDNQTLQPQKSVQGEDGRKELTNVLSLVSKMCQVLENSLFSETDTLSHTFQLGSTPNLQEKSSSVPTDSSFQSLFRSLWYFVVVLDLVGDESAQDHIVDIALYTPILHFASVVESYFQSPHHKTRLLRLVPPAFVSQVNILTNEQALYLLAMFHVMCCCAAEVKLDVVAFMEKILNHRAMLAVIHPLLLNVITQFFCNAKSQRRVQDTKSLTAFVVQLLNGCAHAHAQIALTCRSLFELMYENHRPIMYELDAFRSFLIIGEKVPEVNQLISQWLHSSRGNSFDAKARWNPSVTLLAGLLADTPTKTYLVMHGMPEGWTNRFNWFLTNVSQAKGTLEYINTSTLVNYCSIIDKRLESNSFNPPQKVDDSMEESIDPFVADVASANDFEHQVIKLLFQILVYLSHVEADMDLLKHLVHLPLRLFSRAVLHAGTMTWIALLQHRPSLESTLLQHMERGMHLYVLKRRGVFSKIHLPLDPLRTKISSSGDKLDVCARDGNFEAQCVGSLILAEFFMDMTSISSSLCSPLMQMIMHFLKHENLSSHPVTRGPRFALANCALTMALHPGVDKESKDALQLKAKSVALRWFEYPARWTRPSSSSGAVSGKRAKADLHQLSLFWRLCGSPQADISDDKLLHLLVANEIVRLGLWASPDEANFMMPSVADDIMNTGTAYSVNTNAWRILVRAAWNVHPAIALHLPKRFQHPPAVVMELESLVLTRAHVSELHAYNEAIEYLLSRSNIQREVPELRYLAYWEPLPPIEAIALFHPRYGSHPCILQYALRSLFASPVETVFFFVPQIVQALRHDPLGYVQQYILRAAKTSSVFAHQIIWNMKANMYRDEVSSKLLPLFSQNEMRNAHVSKNINNSTNLLFTF
jgi:hypothetical protein